MTVNNSIRPIYSEIQGYLSQAPNIEKVPYIYEKPLWEQLNNVIDELNEKSGEDFSKFKITDFKQQKHEPYSQYIPTIDYRSKLNGLIMRLHGQYFSEEQSPFGGFPSTVVQQNQSQSQTMQITMILEFQSMIDRKLYGSELKPEEKSFLEKVKASLPAAKSTIELMNMCLSLAKSLGINLDQMTKLFS